MPWRVVVTVWLAPLNVSKTSQPGYQGTPCRALVTLSLAVGRRATWEGGVPRRRRGRAESVKLRPLPGWNMAEIKAYPVLSLQFQ